MKWLHRSDLARELCVESLDIDRRVVTAAHIIVGVQHQSRTVVIYLRRHGHHFLSRNTVSWRPARSTHEHRILTPPTKLFTKNPAIYTTFPRSTKHVYTSLACSQDFSKICWRVEICFVVLRQEWKPHWLSSSFGSIIFVASWHALFLGD